MAWTISPVAMVAIAACAVVAGVGAASVLRLDPSRDAPTSGGPGVSIAVVEPREPALVPGSVMDVGDLSDGYKHRPYVRQADYDAPSYEEFEDYPPVRAEPKHVERPRELAYEPAPPPVIIERRERPRRWSFGFDQPRPDYAAERRERMARMEDQRRIDEERMRDRFDDREDREWRDERGDSDPAPERRDRERQWYRSDGTRLSGPETFY